MIRDKGTDVLRFFAQYDAARRGLQSEELKTEILRVPVSDQTLEKISHLTPEDHAVVTRCHPGFGPSREIASLWSMLNNFRQALADFELGIQRLAAHDERNGRLRSHKKQREQIVASIRKDIFAAAAAAKALVELSRKVKKHINNDYDAQRARMFDAGQHEFVMGLRRNLLHITWLEANSKVTYRRDGTESTFEFKRSELLAEGEFNELARAYIRNAGETIDIRGLFGDYGARVDRFYGWLQGQIEAHLSTEIQDYRRCVHAHEACMAKMWHRVFLTEGIKRDVDPYKFLPDYLDSNELEEVNRLPHRSPTQVNRIIELLDDHQACDEELRTLVFRLFKVEE